MQIRSDEQQYQSLDEVSTQIKQSIKVSAETRKRKNFRALIRQAGNANEKNLLENQYYSISVFQDQVQKTKDIKRRFSDFDMLFEIIMRQYKGHILPAFPENGIMSYVKSKVSLTKDDKFLKHRISMVQRFLTILLNGSLLSNQNQRIPQINQFLSQKQFDLFKKRQKQKSQGIISSSWNKIVSYMKISKQSKFKVVEDQILGDKKVFEELERKTKCLSQLIQLQKYQFSALQQQNLAVPNIAQYLIKQRIICEQQQLTLAKITKLQFELWCQNQDYVMVIKVIRNLQQLKNNQQNYSVLQKAERTFASQYEIFKRKKKENIKMYSAQLDELLKQVIKTDAKF